MKLTKRKITILLLVLVVGLAVGVAAYYSDAKKMMARCTDNEDWVPGVANFVVSCHGALSVQSADSPSTDKYIVYDQKHRYEVAGLQNKNAVIETGGFLYVIDQRNKYETDQDGKPHLILQLDASQQFGVIEADRIEDLPHYLKISTTTGIVTPYKNYDQMSEGDRGIFQQLADR